MKRRFFTGILLAVLLMTTILSGCNSDREISSPGTSDAETAAPGTTKESTPVSYSGVTLNGVEIEKYSIIYEWHEKSHERKYANAISEYIRETYDVSVDTHSDSEKVEAEYAIYIGETMDSDISTEQAELDTYDYRIAVKNGNIYLLARNVYGFSKSVAYLNAAIGQAKDTKAISVTDSGKKSFTTDLLTSMTFNIYNWDSSAAHLERMEAVVLEYKPDTIGFQEITATWIGKLMQNSEISALYGYVGVDRQDGTQEQAAIFYRKDKFRLIESQTKWLYGSDPTGAASAGKIKGCVYNRIYTYAVLERIHDGKRFAHINTHLEIDLLETSTLSISEIQERQISYITTVAHNLQAQGYDCILTGDFNCQAASKTTSVGIALNKAGFLRPATQSVQQVNSETFDAQYNANQSMAPKGIDHVFILSDNVYCDTYTYCNKKYNGAYPSDHIPRMATYAIG